MTERHPPRGTPVGPRPRDAGVTTVLACVIAMALIAITGLLTEFGSVLLARHRAGTAADLGALAGAAVVLAGRQAACDRAQAVATANGATVTDCSLDGADVLLTVTVAVHLGPLAATATGRSRAGPVAAPS
jgi:secretion/DNA translocation related TadE-like protein